MNGASTISKVGLWISTLLELALVSVQGFSGNWITYFFVWPWPEGKLSTDFTMILAGFARYHSFMGFGIGLISILIIVFAFTSKSSIYVRILSVLGFLLAASAAMGGTLYVNTAFRDRWSLGQMTDSFVGVFVAYFLQLFFMNKTPRWPWEAK